MNYFDSIYTLIEIAINHNINSSRIGYLNKCLNNKDIENIRNNFPELVKFIPYCKWYILQEKNMLGMSAYIYDMYKETGLLPDLTIYDYEPNIEKLEHWQYVNPLFYEINPETNFEFAQSIYKDCNIWNLFLSGCARMNYYEEKDMSLEQRIKFAIVEYMLRRPQFFNTDDFIDNEILHRKYNKNYKKEE